MYPALRLYLLNNYAFFNASSTEAGNVGIMRIFNAFVRYTVVTEKGLSPLIAVHDLAGNLYGLSVKVCGLKNIFKNTCVFLCIEC